MPATNPKGVSVIELEKLLALLQAIGELLSVPPGQLVAILAKARKELDGSP